MTQAEVKQHRQALKRLMDLGLEDILDWLALADDQLQRSLPQESQLLARFRKIKTEAEERIASKGDDEKYRIKGNCNKVIEYAVELLDSTPVTDGDIKEQVDRAVQEGYFKSIYFKVIVGAAALLLMLISGVATFKVTEQVQAMQRLLDESRKQVADSNAEIAKARAETNNRQAELALLILQGNSDLVKLRITAMEDMSRAKDSFKADVDEKTRQWLRDSEGWVKDAKGKIDSAGDEGKKSLAKGATTYVVELNKRLDSDEKRFRDQLAVAGTRLEAYKAPWVPRVLWSMAKTWLFAPIALMVAILTFVAVLAQRLNLRDWIATMVLFLCAAVAILGIFAWKAI